MNTDQFQQESNQKQKNILLSIFTVIMIIANIVILAMSIASQRILPSVFMSFALGAIIASLFFFHYVDVLMNIILEQHQLLEGATGLLKEVSDSMDKAISEKEKKRKKKTGK